MYSSHTQKTLNVLICILLGNAQDVEPVVVRDEELLSDKGLTDGEWRLHHSLKEPIGSMFAAKVHVFSDSVFSTSPLTLDPTCASNFWDTNSEAVMKRDLQKKKKLKRHCQSVERH